MKKKILLFYFAFFLILFNNKTNAQTNYFVDFNNTTDLTDFFTPSSAPVFTNIPDQGIGNTGSIDVPLGSNDIWTTKSAYGITGEGATYEMSAFFKIKANAGYGGLGFTASSSNDPDSYGSPEFGLGMCFHGGGGFFVNNRVNTSVSWPPDLVIGNWYKMILKVTAKGSNTYDLNFQIWNSDENGVLGDMKTEQFLNDVVNTDVGSTNEIYVYFSAAGSRMEKIDNFDLTLTGATIVNLPNVTTSNPTQILLDGAMLGGNVIAENGSPVVYRGVCWNTIGNPSLSDNYTENGTGSGEFTSPVTGLLPNTVYYVRAYATNSIGTSYGDEISFTTLSTNITNLSKIGISIYPNPTNRIVNFDFSNLKVQKISILDISGKVIIEKTVTSQAENIDFSNYSNGLYLIKLQTDTEILTTKIIKE